MKVRYAKFEDMKAISEIATDSMKITYKGILSDEYLNSLSYEEAHQKYESRFDKGFWCVCENEGEILGYSWFDTKQEEEGYPEYDCELIAIYIKPELKGKGIGKEIFNFVTNELKNKGKRKMILWVLENNLPSIGFYKKIGGKLLGKKEKERAGEIHTEISFGYDLLVK